METQGRTYIAIDLKSFFASVECVERQLNPLTTHLVVADASRTEKTICLAITPSLKRYGLPGRARLFEVVQKVREINRKRREQAPQGVFTGESVHEEELSCRPEWALDYVVAPPRMAKYLEYSTRIYRIYLRYVAAEDVHVYSIDEVFIDVTPYLKTYRMSAHDLAMRMIREVLQETGITATAGIGTNLYLCKIAMDIVAKHIEPDADGVRIAELNEQTYRELLWDHQPLTDFWRVGRGTAARLGHYGIYTMGQLARVSVHNEDLLYRLFGINAELLIDHAWGYEPCTIDLIKAYKPESKSICSGQVLSCAYTVEMGRVVVQEMVESLALKLVDNRKVTDQIVLSVGYDRESLTRPEIGALYKGEIVLDHYGREVPKPVHGSVRTERPTSSEREIKEATLSLFDRIVEPFLLVRRISITANHIVAETSIGDTTAKTPEQPQLDLFIDYEKQERERLEKERQRTRERKMQETLINIKKKFGKNAILKGLNYADGATAKERNRQIGGHKA
jgi:DNA polymerase V